MLGESLRERFGERPEVPIKHEAIKLLASDTRLSILKLLDQRRMTVSELSRQLDLNKSTVHEHLGKLVEGGLIKRDESAEREWVYYELTKTAKYVLQPASARFVLLMTMAVAAGFVMVALLLVAVNTSQDLALDVADDVVPAGSANVWAVEVTRPGLLGFREPADQAELFLLTPVEAAEFQRTGALPADKQALGPAQGLEQAEPGQYRFRAALEPGTHYLLARGPARASDALLPIQAEPVEVLPRVPSVLVGVDAPQVEVAVKFQDEPVSGGLVQALDADGAELAQVPVLNGRAVLPLREAVEEVTFRYQPPAPGSAFVPAEGSLRAEAPHVAFEPAQVPLRVDAAVRVVVDDPATGPRANAPVSIVGPDGTPVATGLTSADGSGVLTVHLREVGDFRVMAGDHEAGRITVQPGLRLWMEPGPHWEGEAVRVRTLFLGQEPKAVGGVAVLLDGREVGTTDAEGWLRLQFGLGGAYRLEARLDGWVPAAVPVDVLPRTGLAVADDIRPGLAGLLQGGAAATPAATQVNYDRVLLGSTVQVEGVVTNRDHLPRVVRAVLYDNDRPVAAQVLDLAPGASEYITFDHAPEGAGVHRLRINDLRPDEVQAVPGLSAARMGGTLALPGPPLWLGLAVVGVAALALAGRRQD